MAPLKVRKLSGIRLLPLLCMALAWTACIKENEEPALDVPQSQQDEPHLCQYRGESCGAEKHCCQGSLCKAGTCSGDLSCAGDGGHCSSSGDCCGLLTCRSGVCGGTTSCRNFGEHCAGSADCCGAGLCRDGVCR